LADFGAGEREELLKERIIKENQLVREKEKSITKDEGGMERGKGGERTLRSAAKHVS